MGLRPVGQGDIYEATCDTCGKKKIVTASMREHAVLALVDDEWRVRKDRAWCPEHTFDSMLRSK